MFEFLKKTIKPIGTGIAIVAGVIAALYFADPIEPPVGPWRVKDFEKAADGKKLVTLTAKDLEQLRWMDVAQLKAIFTGRRGQFQIESSPAAYQELRWMDTDQIEAIFGTKESWNHE